MDKEFAESVAITYINEKVSMQVLSRRFGVSKTTIVKALNGNNLNPSLREILEATKRDRWIESKRTQGNLGHTKISTEKARELAERMVDEGLTLSDLYVDGGPSVSTIYYSFTEDNLGSELYDRVVKNYEKNKSEATRNCPNNGSSSFKVRK